MKWVTEVNLGRLSDCLQFGKRVLLLGSCFSEHIAAKLRYFGFEVAETNFGTLFSPLAIAGVLNTALRQTEFDERHFVQRDSIWVSLDVHSSIYAESKDELRSKLNSKLALLRAELATTERVFITFGSAFVYRFHKTQQVVANCQKRPQIEFQKELLAVEQIVNVYTELICDIKKINPEVKLTFSVSPVRHSKDGLIENARSKATLLLALEKICERHQADYFPAFEIMTDELRDYRFYSADLVHPNEIAVDYIWEKFVETYFSTDTKVLMQKVDQYRKLAHHRPLFGQARDAENLVAYAREHLPDHLKVRL